MMVDCRGRFLQPTRLHSIKGKSPEKCNSKRLQDRSRQHLKEARRKQQATTTTFRDTLEGHLARKIFLPPSVSQTTWMVGWSVGTLKSTMFFFPVWDVWRLGSSWWMFFFSSWLVENSIRTLFLLFSSGFSKLLPPFAAAFLVGNLSVSDAGEVFFSLHFPPFPSDLDGPSECPYEGSQPLSSRRGGRWKCRKIYFYFI